MMAAIPTNSSPTCGSNNGSTTLSVSVQSTASVASSSSVLYNLLGRLWPIQLTVQTLQEVVAVNPDCLSVTCNRNCMKTKFSFSNHSSNSTTKEDDEGSLYCRDSEPLLPIQYAILWFARKGLTVDILQYILEHHPEQIDCCTPAGYNLLHLAIVSDGRAHRAGRKFSSGGASARRRRQSSLGPTNRRLSPPHQVPELPTTQQQQQPPTVESTFSSSRMEIIEYLCSIKPELMYTSNPTTGETPFHCAVTECDAVVIEYFLSLNPSLVRIAKPMITKFSVKGNHHSRSRSSSRRRLSTIPSTKSVATAPTNSSDTASNIIPHLTSNKALFNAPAALQLYPLHMALLDSTFTDWDCILQMIALYPEVCCVAVTKRKLYPIHIATFRKLTSVVQLMIDFHPQSVHYMDTKGNVPLHFVRDPETAAVLIEHDPDGLLISNTDQKQLPIHRACRKCCSAPSSNNAADSSHHALIIHSVSGRYQFRRPSSFHGNSSAPVLSSALADTMMVEVIEAFVKVAPSTIQIPDSDGNLPLHILIERCGIGGGYGNRSGRNGAGEIPSATEYMSPLIDKLIYEYPKSLFVPNQKKGNLPLHIAATWLSPHSPTSIECVRKLVQLHPQSARKKNIDGYLPFHLAILNMVKRLSKSRHGLTSAVDDDRENTTGDDEENRDNSAMVSIQLIQEMIDCYPQCLYRQDSFGRLPIHILLDEVCQSTWGESDSSTSFYIQCLRLMISKCEKSLSCVDSKGRLPLHVAIEQLNNMVVTGQRDLSNHTLNITDDNVENEDDNESASRSSSSTTDSDDGSQYTYRKRLKWCESVCDYVLRKYPKAAEINDCCGRLPLHLMVVGAGDDSITYKFVKYLVDTNPSSLLKPRIDGNLPLHAAIIHGTSDEVIVLLAKQESAALTTYNINGHSPMHLACMYRPSLLVISTFLQLLPACGTQTTLKDKYPPLFLACRSDACLDVIMTLTLYSMDIIIAAGSASSTESKTIVTAASPITNIVATSGRSVLTGFDGQSNLIMSNKTNAVVILKRKKSNITNSNTNSYLQYRRKVYRFVDDIEWIPSENSAPASGTSTEPRTSSVVRDVVLVPTSHSPQMTVKVPPFVPNIFGPSKALSFKSPRAKIDAQMEISLFLSTHGQKTSPPRVPLAESKKSKPRYPPPSIVDLIKS